MPSKGNALNVPRFNKAIQMLEAEEDGVIVATVGQLRTLARAANMHVWEAIEYSYGGSADTAELQAKLNQKEAECTQLHSDFETVQLALQEQLQKNSGEGSGLDPDAGREELVEAVKRTPNFYALAAFVIIGLRLWFYASFQATHEGILGSFLAIYSLHVVTVVTPSFLLIDWCGLTFQKAGIGAVVIKACGTLGGLYMTLAEYLGDTDPHLWTTTPHLQPALTALGITTVFALSSASEKASRLLGSSEAFSAVRPWFL